MAETLRDGRGRRVHILDEVSVDCKVSLEALIAADPDIFRAVMGNS